MKNVSLKNALARPRIFFAGGGTGGHLYPGLAIARAVVERAPQVEPHFIGAMRGIERDVLPTTGFAYSLLDLHPLYRRTPWNNWRTLLGGITAWREINRLARERHPIATVGTGGYAAAAALAWSRRHGVPIALHEPDSYPGLTTRRFSSKAQMVFLGFPEAQQRLVIGSKTIVYPMGCPIEPPPATPPTRAGARRVWNLPDDVFVVLIFGGSQGARALNEAAAAWCARGLPEGVALIWATGRGQADGFMKYESQMVRVRPYLSPISDAYAAADVAITRAGAMTIAELCAWGIPSVLVPLPTAAQDHQAHNARALAATGASIYLPQTELDGDAIDATVRELRERPPLRLKMATAALHRGQPDAAAHIAEALLELVLPP